MLVYVHVPFCARRCTYCDFAIAVRRSVPSDRYAEAVLAEWRLRQHLTWWNESPRVETVYFGGGTPSRLDSASLARILAGIAAERTLVPDAEITLEANPEDIDPDRVRAWRAMGINRISLGAQSFDPAVLRWMHRTHSAEQIGQAVQVLREAGFGNLSLDLIYGLPVELNRNWSADLARALALFPEHLSFYALTVEPGTPLGKWTRRGAVAGAPDDRVASEYLEAHERLQNEGFEHYEVSNAARIGHRAVHNAGYWERRPFVGLGPSAHSGAGRERAWNLREWEGYARAVEAGRDPEEGHEVLVEQQLVIEEQYLGLRTRAGLPEQMVPEAHRKSWIRAGWAESASGRIRLTSEGWLRLDALVASL